MKIIVRLITFIRKQIANIRTYGIRELLRKFYLLIKVLVRIPIDIIALVPCIIIRLISPWIIIRIERITTINFGDFVEHPATYYCKKKLKIDLLKKKCIDLVYIHYKDTVYNRQLAKMWKKKLNFLSGYLLDPISRVNKFIPGWEIHTIKNLQRQEPYPLHLINLNLFNKCQILDFTTKEEIYGKKMLNKFGLKDKDKFVCLAVRDGAYQLKKISARYMDWSYHDFRHTDIDKFVLAAEELTERGYYVFRMGVVVEKPFNSKNPKIIDYANSNLRSDFMDVYLGAKCSFCISTGLGFDNLPCLFGKPLVQLMQPLGHLYTHSEKHLLMTKHHILKKEKRRLSLSEIFSHGVGYTCETKKFEEKGIDLIDFTPEEIKDLVIEMAENLESKKKINLEDEKLQKTFRSLYASNIKRFCFHGELSDASMHGNVRACFGTKFLRENKNWLR